MRTQARILSEPPPVPFAIDGSGRCRWSIHDDPIPSRDSYISPVICKDLMTLYRADVEAVSLLSMVSPNRLRRYLDGEEKILCRRCLIRLCKAFEFLSGVLKK